MVLLDGHGMRLVWLDAFLATAIQGVIRLATGRCTMIPRLACILSEAHLRTGPRTFGTTRGRLDSTKLHLVYPEVTMAVGIVDRRQFRVVVKGKATGQLVIVRMLATSFGLMVHSRAFEASKPAASIVVKILRHRMLILEIMFVRVTVPVTSLGFMAAIRFVSRQAVVLMMAVVIMLMIGIVGVMVMPVRSLTMFVVTVAMAMLDIMFVIMVVMVVRRVPVIFVVMVQMAACTMISIQMRVFC
jgi:hypothetical protein